MPMLGVLFGGKSEGELRARQARIDAEDRLLAINPLEHKNLSFHVLAEANRNAVFITRLRDIHATLAAKSDRNLWAVLILGGLLLAKGIITPQEIGKAVQWVANVL